MQNIPDWAIQSVAVGTIGFVFKVVFGLINKNEEKSDESDRRINNDLKDMRSELKDLERKFVENDRELYVQTGVIREKAEYQKGLQDGKTSKD